MDRRKFLGRMVAAASLTVASPLTCRAIPGIEPEDGHASESPAGIPISNATSFSRTMQAELAKGFVHPPESAAPWVYWMWINVDTTPAAMTFDLEQMKAKGIPGFILYNSPAGNVPPEEPRMVLVDEDHHFEFEFVQEGKYTDCYTTPIPFPPLQAWTPLWRERIRYVAKESARLNLKFCLNMGLAGTSGNISAEFGNQKLVWSATAIDGEETFDGILTLPDTDVGEGKTVRSANFLGTDLGHLRDVAVLAIPARVGFSVNDVFDLISKMDANGHLVWTPPAGKWKVLRFMQTPTGARNSFGLFSDAMSSEATDQVWSVTVAPLLAEILPEERRGLVGIEDDSWEGGEFTWTKRFAEEFMLRRGYDLIPYLPIIAGVDMADAITRERIQRDYKVTASDLMADYHYGRLEKLCKENGLIFYSEAAGPNLHTADLLQNTSRVDLPMAEFWMPSYHRPTPESRFWRAIAHAPAIFMGCRSTWTRRSPAWARSGKKVLST